MLTGMAERAEESADVAEQKRGRFEGGEVASFFKFGPADDMVVAICETANGHILRQRDGHRRRDRATLLGCPRLGIVEGLIVEIGGGARSAGEPIET